MPIMKYMIVRISQPLSSDANYIERIFVVVSRYYNTAEDAYKCLLEEHKENINDFMILNYWAEE